MNHTTRRQFLKAGMGALALGLDGIRPGGAPPAFAGAVAGRGDRNVDARPSPQQLAWQEAGLSMFLHFGMNTFTDREWGEGNEDPRLFNPAALDCAQWAQVAKDAGFKYLILTAKHHDGFCLWPSRYTEHSVKNSPWRGGKGDVVGEFARACRDAGLEMGLYVSPWDRHEPTYGDSPAYNRHYVSQLTELMTKYGEVAEVWFDGACGEGPNGKKQEYDWPAFYAAIREHQPKALIAICGPDIRWVGNEDGYAQETEWSVQDANPGLHPDVTGKVWWPAECDVSIRPGWFWHKREDAQVKSLAHLMDIYYKSVGRNSVLLLNVPPNDHGLLAEPDVARLHEFRSALDRTLAHDLARGKAAAADSAARGHDAGMSVDDNPETYWMPGGNATSGWLEIDLGRPITFNLTIAREYIPQGQHVEEYLVQAWHDGAWVQVVKGTTIGCTKLDRFPTVRASKVRLTLARSRGCPRIRTFGIHHAPTYSAAP